MSLSLPTSPWCCGDGAAGHSGSNLVYHMVHETYPAGEARAPRYMWCTIWYMKLTPRSSRRRQGRAWNAQYADQRLAGLCTAPILSALSGRRLKRRAQSGVEDVALHIAPSPRRLVRKDKAMGPGYRSPTGSQMSRAGVFNRAGKRGRGICAATLSGAVSAKSDSEPRTS